MADFTRHDLVTTYKFGVLYQGAGQDTEEQIFSNKTHSQDMETFLQMMGSRVDWVDRVDWVVGHWVMGHRVVGHPVMWHMGMNWISVTLFCFGFSKRYDKWHQ